MSKRGLSVSSEDGVLWLAVLLACVSFVFGGASRNNPLGASIIAFTAAPLLALSLWRLFSTPRWRGYRIALALTAAVVIVVGIQLVPVPRALYAVAPGREEGLAALAVAGLQPRFLPLSMNPEATRMALMGCIAPAAMLLAVLSGPLRLVRRLVVVYLVLAGLSIILGLGQMGARNSALYLYPWTGVGNFVGPFANRNHEATFLLMGLPLSAVVVSKRRKVERWGLLIAGASCLIALIALAAIRSRFGILVAMPVCVVTMLLAVWDGRQAVRARSAVSAGGAILVLALSVILPLGLTPILDRFAVDGAQQSRLLTWDQSIELAERYSLLGAGPGSFDVVYRAAEHPEKTSLAYMNEAHNDYIQVWLEAGVAGVLVLAAVLLSFLVGTVRAWRSSSKQAATAQVAAISIGIVALHSMFDYPLRSPSLTVFSAFISGLIALGCFESPNSDRP